MGAARGGVSVLRLLRCAFFRRTLLKDLFTDVTYNVVNACVIAHHLMFVDKKVARTSFKNVNLKLCTKVSPLLSTTVFSMLSSFKMR